MSIWDRLFGAKQKGFTNTGGVQFMFTPNGSIVPVGDSKQPYIDNGYAGNAVVYSIIKHISDKIATLPFSLYQVDNKKEFNRYKSLGQNIKHGSLIEYTRCRKKALKEVDGHPLTELLEGMGFEGRSELNGFRDITGDAYLWKIRATDTSDPVEYRVLPSQWMAIIMGDDPWSVKGYRMNAGRMIDFTEQEVAHWKHWNPFFDTAGRHLYGLSPLKAAYYDLMSSNEGKKSLANEFKNNGIRGAIVRGDDVPWTTEQRDSIRDYVDESFNGNENRGKIKAMNIKASWMQMGLSSSEMELARSLQITKEDICNAFQFPPRLIAAIEGTFNNVEAAERQLITHCVYPRALSYRDFVNRSLLPDFKDSGGLFYDVDITSLPEMQTDIKALVETLSAAPITLNEFRVEMGRDEIADPNMDKVYIPSTKIPLDQANQDLGASMDQTLNDLNQAGAKDYDY